MKDIFMSLLLNLTDYGRITAANLYKEGKFSTIEIESDDAVYTVSIVKEEKKGEKENA